MSRAADVQAGYGSDADGNAESSAAPTGIPGRILTVRGQESLKAYKNCGEDQSYLRKYVMNHFYEWCMRNLVPDTVAPNVITLSGFVLVSISFFICVGFCPTWTEAMPRWVYFFNAITMFVYQTLDNLDGKQARKTGTSSALGELFDHGCDALVCALGGSIICCTLRLGANAFSWLVFVAVFIPFFFATWEEYWRGGLFLGPINGPNEGIMLLILIHLTAGFGGADVWTTAVGSQTLAHLVVYVELAASLFTIIDNYKNIRNAVQAKNASMSVAHMNLIPLIALVGLSGAWFGFSHSGIFGRLPFVFALTMGVTFGFIASNLTLAFLTKEPYPSFFPIIIPFIINAALAPLLEPTAAIFFLCAHLAAALFFYTRFVALTINEITSCLRISALSIKYALLSAGPSADH